MSHYKKILISILAIQVLIIGYLCFSLYAKKAFSPVFVAPLDKTTLHSSPSGTLRYFYEPKPNITITEAYYQLVSLPFAPQYTINKDTLNERFDYPIQKDTNTFRIITLGDSFTFGHYINTADNWPESLEIQLETCTNKKFEVINLAVPGYDIQYSVERYKKRGIKYNPDLVIWFLKNDDFDQINEITYPLKMKYLKEMKQNGEFQKSIAKGQYWPHTEKAIQELKKKYTVNKILAEQLKIMRSLNNYYTGTLLVVSPENKIFFNTSVVQAFAKNRKKTFTYLNLPNFSRLPDGHPNKEGHTQIAKNIYTNLLKQQLVSCTQ